jgi:NUDIX domain
VRPTDRPHLDWTSNIYPTTDHHSFFTLCRYTTAVPFLDNQNSTTKSCASGMLHIFGILIIIFCGLLPLLQASGGMPSTKVAFTAVSRVTTAAATRSRSLEKSSNLLLPSLQTASIPRSVWCNKRKRSRVQVTATTWSTRSAMSLSSASSSSSILPRAAVSVVVQCCCKSNEKNKKDNDVDGDDKQYYYLLIQRGKEPNKGKWSFPGGKIEHGETTLQGAMRELGEETKWPPPLSRQQSSAAAATTTTTMDNSTRLTERSSGTRLDIPAWERSLLRWYPMPITVSDSIGEGFHYMIAQCFAELPFPLPTTISERMSNSESSSTPTSCWPPPLLAADDAARADWFTPGEIQNMEQVRLVTPGVSRVVVRAKELSQHGLLPTVHAQQLL